MPQMAPMNWTLLMFTFVLTFLIISSINYFNTKYSPIYTKPSKKHFMMSWKW
uniref:ATP synthase complex subunit 8 n=1 Tax=Figulus binodulus TaxID=273949 RepID=A0A5J6KAV5_9SCAR|nr:ATP synthase F0 subunit 8 [Figulus binodulus]QEV84368.1 ATP synthase F0 subunit 8 [Figulus binodulus]